MERKPKRFKDLLNPGKEIRAFGGALSNEFIIPPFSVFDAASKDWANRRRQWGRLDLLKVTGRDLDMSYHTEKILKDLMGTTSDNTSRFDPVLAEVMYTWFAADEGMVLDPFAGGHVRGIVACMLGYGYVGIDLSERQVDDNYRRLKEYGGMGRYPSWLVGDSTRMKKVLVNAPSRQKHPGPGDDTEYGFVFSCPPYFDLEKYTDNPNDLSNMSWEQFQENYRQCIWNACSRLADDSFAAFVVGDLRDENGLLRNLPGVTIEAFQDSGVHFYNDIVMTDPLGSAILRARRNFITGKVSKVHQYVLVFVKGDPRKAFAKTRAGRLMIKEMAEAKKDKKK